MYAEHMPLIREYGRTPDGFATLVAFAIATQNQYFFHVDSIMGIIRSDGAHACTRLKTRQKAGILHVQVRGAKYLPLPPCTADALRLLIEIPSIGIVKGSFVLQMLGYPVGCLDVHNIRMAGLSARVFSRVPARTEALSLRLETYLNVCTQMGGAEVLWNTWCTLIACKYPHWFKSAEAVSAYHVHCVMGEREKP